MNKNFDLIVVGAGPAGYTGAIRAAQLGMTVAIIEKERTLGGTCLNVGCIPSKALLDSSELFSQAQHDFSEHGIETKGIKLNLPSMMKRKEKVVHELTQGIEFLMKKNKITVFKGVGTLTSANAVQVQDIDKQTTTLNGKNILLATGSLPVELPFMKFDRENIISSTEALSLNSVPEHLIVVGGGVIGLELGSVWLRLGAKVTILEFADNICAGMDQGIAKKMKSILSKQGMEFLLKTKVTGAAVKNNRVSVKFESLKSGETGSIKGSQVLVAVGRRAYSQELGLDNIGVQVNKQGKIITDHQWQTSVPNIYAVGDVIDGPMLAHKAEEEAVAVAENLSGQHGHVNYETVPGVIYTWPEVASVGATEEQLKENNTAYNSGSFPFSANGRAKAHGFTEGLVKILADKTTDRILGVHIIGPRASDIISEAVIAMEFGGSSEDLARSFHAHPTFSEAIREAALAVDKRVRQS